MRTARARLDRAIAMLDTKQRAFDLSVAKHSALICPNDVPVCGLPGEICAKLNETASLAIVRERKRERNEDASGALSWVFNAFVCVWGLRVLLGP